MELWTEFKELVYATIFDEGLAPLQQFHEDSQREIPNENAKRVQDCSL